MKCFYNLKNYKPKLCVCGCKEYLRLHTYYRKNKDGTKKPYYAINFYIKGHGKRGLNGFNSKIHTSQLCSCGCGELTMKLGGRYNRFIRGHENIGKTPWNKGKRFSEESRERMSLARLGKEPANKIHLDLKKIYQLYLIQKMSSSQVAEVMGVATSVIKNRIRKLGISRSTKETCSLADFRERMREIRIRTLTSKPFIESPNKLEKLVYDTLDQYKIRYQKQAPLFQKFVVDVLFPKQKIVLEIFGKYWHENPIIKKKDFSKKRYLNKCGYKVEEIWDYQIRNLGIGHVLEKVLNKYSLI